MRTFVHMIVLTLLLTVLTVSTACATVLFYGGTPHSGGHSCFIDPNTNAECRSYDNFHVSQTWVINEVWGNYASMKHDGNYMPASAAYYEIRKGVSDGTGGVLLFSGQISVTQTILGIDQYDMQESCIRGTLPDIRLDQGDYWLTLAPIIQCGYFGGYYISYTFGNDGAGSPLRDEKTYADSPNFYSFNWQLLTVQDFSYGLAGTIVPEPSSILALLCGIGGMSGVMWRNR